MTMRNLTSSMILFALAWGSAGAWAQGGGERPSADSTHSRASWRTYTEASVPFSFSCPDSWVYDGKGLGGVYGLTSPQGAVGEWSVTISIASYPGDRSLLEKRAADSSPDPVDKNKVGSAIPTLKWHGWRTALGGRVYERALDCLLPVDGSHYTRIYRHLQVKDNLLCLVVSVPEPYSPDQLRLLQAVMDTFRYQPSIYEQLEL